MLVELLLLVALAHTLVVGVVVLLEKRNPTSAVAWLLAITFLPLIGVWAYLIVGRSRFVRRSRRFARFSRALRTRIAAAGLTRHGLQPGQALAVPQAQRPLVDLACRVSDSPLSPGNETTLLSDATSAYPAMEAALRAAQDSIHLEYYIFHPDETGLHLLDILAEKARAGVEVRLLVDDFGSSDLHSRALAPLRAAGGHCAFSMRTRFPRIFDLWRINYRNHRKIVVVDGQVAFTGGMNIGDEYLGEARQREPWRDLHLRVEGPAVGELQRVFAEDWLAAAGEMLAAPRYYPAIPAKGDALVQIIPSGPDRPWDPIHKLYFAGINTSLERVYITSPYFVPDQAILLALSTAALRGVDVRLLLPGRSDQPIVRLAGRSYYEELLRAGVRIYEYRAGILHTKSMCVDGRYGTLGSANMDIRSFHLNFEVNAFLYSEPFAQQLERNFLDDLAKATEIDAAQFLQRSWPRRLPERLAGLLSGLL